MLSQAVLAILFAGAIPAVACTPKLDVTVTGEHHSPVVRSTYDVDAIRALAVSTGQPLRHGALGFYIATIGYEVELAKGMLAAAECSVVTAVVRLSLGPHLIEIARDLEARGCRREVVLSHFMHHAQYDARVMGDYVARTLATFKAKAEARLLGAPNSGDARSVATDGSVAKFGGSPGGGIIRAGLVG